MEIKKKNKSAMKKIWIKLKLTALSKHNKKAINKSIGRPS